jgi:hypothetical protein
MSNEVRRAPTGEDQLRSTEAVRGFLTREADELGACPTADLWRQWADDLDESVSAARAALAHGGTAA